MNEPHSCRGINGNFKFERMRLWVFVMQLVYPIVWLVSTLNEGEELENLEEAESRLVRVAGSQHGVVVRDAAQTVPFASPLFC